MPEQPTDYRVAVFGSGGVGKTSLVLRFVRGTFRETYIPTIEDTYRQVISCNRQVCTLQITDTTGSHQFPAMQRLSITKAHAFILVYSITNKSSFDELQLLYNELTIIKMNELPNIPIMLVGNKLDENNLREVSQTFGKTLAQKWKCGFIETSAKTNTNVKELFQDLLKMETRRNMTLVGEIKSQSKFLTFFKRNRTNSQSTSYNTSSTNLIDNADMPKQINTQQEQSDNDHNNNNNNNNNDNDNNNNKVKKERKLSKLKSFLRHKSTSNASPEREISNEIS